jgi:hypothetical protein
LVCSRRNEVFEELVKQIVAKTSEGITCWSGDFRRVNIYNSRADILYSPHKRGSAVIALLSRDKRLPQHGKYKKKPKPSRRNTHA